MSINNAYIQSPSRTQSPHHSQNSIRNHNLRLNKQNQNQNLATNLGSRRSSQLSLNKPLSLDNITLYKPLNTTTIPEDQNTVSSSLIIENTSQGNSNDSVTSPLPSTTEK